jgi:hypothetical protein
MSSDLNCGKPIIREISLVMSGRVGLVFSARRAGKVSEHLKTDYRPVERGMNDPIGIKCNHAVLLRSLCYFDQMACLYHEETNILTIHAFTALRKAVKPFINAIMSAHFTFCNLASAAQYFLSRMIFLDNKIPAAVYTEKTLSKSL